MSTFHECTHSCSRYSWNNALQVPNRQKRLDDPVDKHFSPPTSGWNLALFQYLHGIQPLVEEMTFQSEFVATSKGKPDNHRLQTMTTILPTRRVTEVTNKAKETCLEDKQ